ncbi:putative alcohol dehydrogenase [Thozetella sp. PMI_491]|nr:putative alcohol dehydrogenase [Thozetella sp. PMI_491]
MARQWVLTGQEGFEISLEYQENVAIPSADELGPNEVLVRMHGASLNYRELVIARGGINGPINPPVIPSCDGAGVVEAVGASVKEFKAGDRVVTFLAPELVQTSGDDAYSTITDVAAMLGQGTPGTLRSKGVFHETALVHAPTTVDFVAAATLTCTWATAWNGLFGLKGREAGPDTWVLVQGTGGVSIAALQLATAVGATVVATTSTDAKAARLRSLGAAHTVNYRGNPEGWAQEARAFTPGGRGFDIIFEVGGYETLAKSLGAVRTDGILLLVGGVGSEAEAVPLFAALMHTCIVRGLLGGSRAQLRQTARFIDEKGLKPAVDDVVFELAEAKDAYRRLSAKQHFSKVAIRIDHPNAA